MVFQKNLPQANFLENSILFSNDSDRAQRAEYVFSDHYARSVENRRASDVENCWKFNFVIMLIFTLIFDRDVIATLVSLLKHTLDFYTSIRVVQF